MHKKFLVLSIALFTATALFALPGTSQAVCNDVTAPTVSAQATFPPDNGHNAYSYQPSVVVSSYDPDNCGGVVLWYRIGENSTYIGTTSSAFTLKMPYGYDTLSYYAVDPAGHTSTVQTLVLIVDDQAKPTAAATVTPGSPDGTNGWYMMTPVVALTADDGPHGSGIRAVNYKLDFDAYTPYTSPIAIPDGEHTLFYRADDNAGLVQDYVMNFKVDRGLPQVSFTSPLPTVTSDSSVLFEGYATDTISGPVLVKIDDVSIPVDMSTGKFSVRLPLLLGENTMTLVATDRAGRTINIQKNVTYKRGTVLGVTTSAPILRNANKHVVRRTNVPNFKQRIILSGKNFARGALVQVGTQLAVRTTVAEPSTIIAYIEPKKFSKGMYNITVVNPDGQQSTLKAGLRIR